MQPARGETPDEAHSNQLAIVEMVAGFASWGLLRYDEALEHFRRMESWAKRLTASAQPRWSAEGSMKASWATCCIGDVLVAKGTEFIPEAIARHYLPGFADRESRYAAGQMTNLEELATLQATSDSLGVAYWRLGQDVEALPRLRLAHHLAQEVARLQRRW